MQTADLKNLRPTPDDELVRLAWAHSEMRYRMMEGDWREYADARMGDFFAPEVRAFLPPAEISGNPALSITLQMATLYDEEPRLDAIGPDGEQLEDDVLEPLEEDGDWSVMQDVLESVVGINDCAVFTGYGEGIGAYMRIARPHEYIDRPDKLNPAQAEYVRHLELSSRPTETGAPPIMEWTWTTWDKNDPDAFIVEAVVRSDDGTKLEDVTDIYWPGASKRPGGSRYPFWRRDNTPIWPWTLYHRRIGQRTRSTYSGREIWDGTLTFAALQTYWLAGFRDGAHPQRWALDAESTMAGTQDVGGTGAKVVRMNQMGVMMFKSLGERTGNLSQFAPAMDPKSSGEAMAAWAAALAVYAGVAPQDVSVSGGTVGQSGYAIALSRDGQRRVRRKLEVPMARGDQLRIATKAALLNAYTDGPELPEDPAAYRITYHDLERSADERKADREEAVALKDLGLIGLVDMYLQWNPGTTREQAIAAMVRSAEEDIELRARIAAISPPAEVPPPAEPTVVQADQSTAEIIA